MLLKGVFWYSKFFINQLTAATREPTDHKVCKSPPDELCYNYSILKNPSINQFLTNGWKNYKLYLLAETFTCYLYIVTCYLFPKNVWKKFYKRTAKLRLPALVTIRILWNHGRLYPYKSKKCAWDVWRLLQPNIQFQFRNQYLLISHSAFVKGAYHFVNS